MADESDVGVVVAEKGSRADYWRDQIRACEASGLTIERYCREQGVSVSGYHWWKRDLKRRTAAAASAAGTGPAAGFVEVKVVSGPVVGEDGALEVVLAGTRRVRVHPGFDEATLRRLVPVLESLGW